VRGGHFVATSECFLIDSSLFAPKIVIAIFLAVVHVGVAMIAEVPARTFDSFVESAPLELVEFSGRHFPAFLAIAGGGGRREGRGPGFGIAGIPG
jgi:hypothetical protein